MMLKALTFLGTGPKEGYQSTIYRKHDENTSCKTHLFPEAVVELYKPEKTVLFITPKVMEDENGYLKYLSGKLNSKLQLVKIPNGNSEVDLWEIFGICADSVNPNDEIILDISHAFRSIPLLIFIVAAYLRQVKNVRLKHIIYGAYDARDRNTNISPIFELTPFVQLLDWMNAVNVFQNSGDARPIAELDIQDDIAGSITNLSEALLTNRTLEAQDAAFKFNGLGFDSPQAPPFQMLIDQLKQSYQRMAVNNPSDNQKNSLKAQYMQIKWYMDNQHYLQAITLMREWLISYECPHHQGDWLSQTTRGSAEDALNGRTQNQSSPFAQLTTDNTLIELWEQCSQIRNDLAHCGMRLNPESATESMQAIQELFDEFEKFVQQDSD